MYGTSNTHLKRIPTFWVCIATLYVKFDWHTKYKWIGTTIFLHNFCPTNIIR